MNRREVWLQLRKPYEFPQSVKIEALNNAKWRCEECGKHKNQAGFLEIDHKVPIHFAINYLPQIAPECFKTIENCRVLCKPCHEKVHITERKSDYVVYAQALLGMV